MVNGQSQSMNPGVFSLAGAVDLEGVKRRVEAQAKQAARASAAGDQGAQSSAPKAGGYVIDVNEQSFQAMVQTSVSFPIILLLWQSHDEASFNLASQLADAVTALDGRMQLARIDADESPSIAQALRAQQLPAIYGLIGGRPMPISQGLPSDDELQQICSTIMPQLVQVAERSGVAGTAPFVEPANDVQSDASGDDAGDGDSSSSSAGQVPPAHEQAHALAMQGDYAAAAAEYAKVLEADPHDVLAARERAKALLLARNANADVAAVRKAAGDNPDDVEAQLAVADVDMIDGHIDDAFGRLLDFLAGGHRADAESIRARMLEYFAMLPADDPRLARARRRLAILLY